MATSKHIPVTQHRPVPVVLSIPYDLVGFALNKLVFSEQNPETSSVSLGNFSPPDTDQNPSKHLRFLTLSKIQG